MPLGGKKQGPGILKAETRNPEDSQGTSRQSDQANLDESSSINHERTSHWRLSIAGVLLAAVVALGAGLSGSAELYSSWFGSSLQQGVTFGASNGVFPKGCKWRIVQSKQQQRDFWEKEEYEFWCDETLSWNKQKPDACLLAGTPKADKHVWKRGTPHSQVWCDTYSCLYQNLWYHNGSWMLLVGDGNPEVEWWSMTRNVDLNIKYVANTSAFAEDLDFTTIEGSTLLLNFPYFHHPTAIGHWGEVMYPLYSIFKEETNFTVPPDQFVLLHLKRSHLMEWPRAIMAATLGLQKGEPLPRIVLQAETDDILQQVFQPLEGVRSDQWLCFETCLVVNDLPSGGIHSFFNQEHAQQFRALMYANIGLSPPKFRIPPRRITYQKKRANRRVVNEEQLIQLLRTYGEVQVAEFNASTPMEEQLRIIAGTGVFVSVHTSNLANAQFLQPGSAVFEIIQRNWFWAEMDLTFKMQTKAMGDIHHFAWRAEHRNQTVYLDSRDREQFGNWTAEMCETEECVEAHTRVDVVVDLEQFQELLDSRLPLVFQGTSVKEAEIPWPGRGSNLSSPFHNNTA